MIIWREKKGQPKKQRLHDDINSLDILVNNIFYSNILSYYNISKQYALKYICFINFLTINQIN